MGPPGAGWGGWAEIVYTATDAWKLHLGTTRDNASIGHLRNGNPHRNFTGYVGTVYDINKDLRVAFDTIYWQTDWVGQPMGNMLRFDLYFVMNF